MTKIEYTKPALTIAQQLSKLQERGLLIDNTDSKNIFSNINYYRLSAYGLPFKQRDIAGNVSDNFQRNTALSDILALYEFDRKLRLIVMDALERIEISIKANITHYMALQYGSYGLENIRNFHKSFSYAGWIKQVYEEISRSKERFIEHFKEKYLDFPKLPIWMAIEVMSFGSVSKLYKGLRNHDKQKISSNYDLHPKTLISWLHFLTYIRNICAHHSRLWNKELTIKPRLDEFERFLPFDSIPKNNRSFIVLIILKYLLNKTGNGTEWTMQCEKLIEPILMKYSWAYDSMDIPKNWYDHPLWKNEILSVSK